MKKSMIFLGLSFLLLFSACKKTYHLDEKQTKIGWTAFKFTNKTGVAGHFSQFKILSPHHGKSIVGILKRLKFSIDSSSLKTGNPARDANISANFFQKFSGGTTIQGKVQKLEGNDQKGTLFVLLTFHKIQQNVSFSYEVKKGGKFEAKASFDMLKMGLKKPFETIHKSCEKLHIGKDGVSKTWSDVLLHVSASFDLK